MKTMKYSELPKEIKLQDDVNTLLEVNEELRKIIDKAIKYIEDFKKVYKEEVYIPLEEVLNILRGEDDE